MRGKKTCYGGDDLNEDMEETGGVERFGVDAVRNNRESPVALALTFEYDNEETWKTIWGQWRVTGNKFCKLLQTTFLNRFQKKTCGHLVYPKWSARVATVASCRFRHHTLDLRYTRSGVSDDDLHTNINIVKANIALKNSIQNEDPSFTTNQYAELLQYHCSLINNELAGQPQDKYRNGSAENN